MAGRNPSFLNTGIYTVPEAARLTGVSTWRIRRWLRGYKFRTRKKQEHRSQPVWDGQLEPIDHSLALGFLDLVEIRFVNAFIGAGVSWAMLRKAHERGAEVLRTGHPFCSNRFCTDGHEILVRLYKEAAEEALVEIVRNQEVFAGIVRQFLKDLEFGEDEKLMRWRPATPRRLVVLDPTRSFGHPIVCEHGVRTEILARAASASGSLGEVSQWYEVTEDEIEDAVEFERALAA